MADIPFSQLDFNRSVLQLHELADSSSCEVWRTSRLIPVHRVTVARCACAISNEPDQTAECHGLRFTKMLSLETSPMQILTTPADVNGTAEAPLHAGIDESQYELFEEDEDEVLMQTLDTSGDHDDLNGITLVYDIIYSTSYGAPVLYVYLDQDSGKNKGLMNSIDLLVPSIMRAQIHQAGVLGAISQTVSDRQPISDDLLF